ncbi:MAG: riboflavin synthase [Endomicrobiales bacterium]
MFTGIIEDIGFIKAITSSKVEVVSSFVDIAPGDSVSVNGICLTAVAITPCQKGVSLSFDYSSQTLRHTSLGGIKTGDRVNLERALKVGGRLGGHFVSGHVECQATVTAIKKDKESFLFTFTLQPAIKRYIVSRGSIAIDGISLTVGDVMSSEFTVAVIPHTFEHTTLKYRIPGDTVNIEPDILAKYCDQLITGNTESLSREFLLKNGF